MTQDFTAQELAEACARQQWSDDPASQALGLKLQHIAPGKAVFTMQVSAAMVNGHGTCHGGFLFALADSAFAFAANSHNQRVVAAQCEIAYLSPAQLGDVLTATAIERVKQERSSITDVSVIRSDGTLIAEFRGHGRTVKGFICELIDM